MEVKRQHINFIIILCFIWGCGGDKPTTPEQTLQTYIYSTGEYYGDVLGYVEYLAGNTPVIITVPHDGTLSPSSIADRTYGTMVKFKYKKKRKLQNVLHIFLLPMVDYTLILFIQICIEEN